MVKEYGPTDKVFDDYMKSSLSASSSPVWIAESMEKKNFNIRSVRVVDCQTQERQVFTCDEEFSVCIETELNLVKNGIVGRLDFVRADDGIVAWHSQSNDTESCLSLHEGRSVILVKVPARTLAAGDYFVSLKFTEKGMRRSWTIAKCDNILKIALHDYTTPLGDSRQGYLSVLLDWKIQS